MKSVLGAVQTMHATGMTHRDIKPDNIMMTTNCWVSFLATNNQLFSCSGLRFLRNVKRNPDVTQYLDAGALHGRRR